MYVPNFVDTTHELFKYEAGPNSLYNGPVVEILRYVLLSIGSCLIKTPFANFSSTMIIGSFPKT